MNSFAVNADGLQGDDEQHKQSGRALDLPSSRLSKQGRTAAAQPQSRDCVGSTEHASDHSGITVGQHSMPNAAMRLR